MMLVKLAAEIVPGLKRRPSYQPLPLGTERRDGVREIIVDDEACATAVFRATQTLLGQQILGWEPESIWLELEMHNLDISEINRDKFMAMSTLLQVPAFFWDANMFENTSLAFNNVPVIPEMLQEASPAQLSWATYEAVLAMQGESIDPEFDYEPKKYAAVSMQREGLVLAPEVLVFAQAELDKLNRGNQEIKGEVKSRWEEVDKTKLDALELSESPTDVQLGKFAAIQMYMNERALKYGQDLARRFA